MSVKSLRPALKHCSPEQCIGHMPIGAMISFPSQKDHLLYVRDEKKESIAQYYWELMYTARILNNECSSMAGNSTDKFTVVSYEFVPGLECMIFMGLLRHNDMKLITVPLSNVPSKDYFKLELSGT